MARNRSVNFKHLLMPMVAMFAITSISNYLVELPINQWLTWGAFSYPISFLVTELTNRYYGPRLARLVVYLGFAFAILLGFFCMNQRIALACGLAFLVGQLVDIAVFNKLRYRAWWLAPWTSSVAASSIDTVIFFSVAFAGGAIPWVTLAFGDFLVKLAVDACLLLPFRFVIWGYKKAQYT